MKIIESNPVTLLLLARYGD